MFKNSYFVVFFVLSLLVTKVGFSESMLFGHLNEVSGDENKVCVVNNALESSEEQNIIFDLEDLEICQEGIFVYKNNSWIQLRTVTHHSDGTLSGNYIPLGKTCPKCKTENGILSTKCRKCGHPLK